MSCQCLFFLRLNTKPEERQCNVTYARGWIVWADSEDPWLSLGSETISLPIPFTWQLMTIAIFLIPSSLSTDLSLIIDTDEVPTTIKSITNQQSPYYIIHRYKPDSLDHTFHNARTKHTHKHKKKTRKAFCQTHTQGVAKDDRNCKNTDELAKRDNRQLCPSSSKLEEAVKVSRIWP